ncbi:hypothetical protein b3_0078 [Synechococcus phage B3]|nr:hypothetical protein b3_0078 [Synechococcus phage B3]QGT54692.1 hypothetical protein b23_0077 [Synechococcus phage B23]
MSDIRNCYTCGHCLERDMPMFMKCALNGGIYCEDVMRYYQSRCSWVPREPTLWELIEKKLKEFLK